MEVPVYNLSGEIIRQIDISDDVFAVPFNEALVHQAMVRHLANARQGTASTKTRGQVSGSSRKPFRQKGTGNARAGSVKSPLRRGGGIVFGPHPRDYRQDMPKRMRQKAIRCLLSKKASDGELMVLDGLEMAEPKTREMARILGVLGIDAPALIAMQPPAENVAKSVRNIEGISTTPVNLLNVVVMLSCRKLLMTEAAVRQVESLWGNGSPEEPEHASL